MGRLDGVDWAMQKTLPEKAATIARESKIEVFRIG
jgi:hypothetical protein